MDLDHDLKTKIDNAIDNLVNILKRDILFSAATGPVQKRGLWDRFKNWMSNLAYGRYGQKNPYYFINRLGDIGGVKLPSKEPTKENIAILPSQLSVNEYKELGVQFEIFCENLFTISEAELPKGTENLYIIRLLDDLKNNLKKVITKIVSDHIEILSKTKPEPEIKPEAEVKPVPEIKPEAEVKPDAKPEPEVQDVTEPSDAEKVEPTSEPIDEQEFPFDHPSTIDGLKDIQKIIKRNKTYKDKLQHFSETASEIDLQEFWDINKEMKDILYGRAKSTEEVKDAIDKYKTILSHIISDKTSSDEVIKFESKITPLNALSLQERTLYYKKLLLER